MKVHIIYRFTHGPWGGGNQFLTALKTELKHRSLYAENPSDANVFVWNSHHQLADVLTYKSKYPQAKFIHRLDGIPALFRNNDVVDKQIVRFNQLAEASIFQSYWSKSEWYKRAHFTTSHTIIPNAPDPTIFYPASQTPPNKKPHIIITSWSNNWQKGYSYYQALDKYLDSNYQVSFYGNSPIQFKNINMHKPLSSNKLAEKLRTADIYLTASQNDACPNALLEALACGLPAVALDSGAHQELIGSAGELFASVEDMFTQIDQVVSSIDRYRQQIKLKSFQQVISKYIEVCNTTQKTTKPISAAHANRLRVSLYIDNAKLIFYKQLGKIYSSTK